MTFIPQKNEKYCFISCSEDKIKSGRCSCVNNKQIKYSFMKTLELKLKKDVLIVDLEDNEATHIKGYEFLCDGSELTEEITSELVDFWQNTSNDGFIYENYKTNLPKKETAVESFISEVESKGFYWLKHNVKSFSLYDPRSKTGCHDLEEEDTITKQWQEAEEKTFRNPLIFVKKS